jgi:hypothetical protein
LTVTLPLTADGDEVTRTQNVWSALAGVVSMKFVAPSHVVPTVAVTPAGVLPIVAVMRWAMFLPSDVSSTVIKASATDVADFSIVTPAGVLAV